MQTTAKPKQYGNLLEQMQLFCFLWWLMLYRIGQIFSSYVGTAV